MAVTLESYKKRLQKQHQQLEKDLEYYKPTQWRFYETRAKLTEIKNTIKRVNDLKYPMHLVWHFQRLQNNPRMARQRYWRGKIFYILSLGFFKTTTQGLISDGIKLANQLEAEQNEAEKYKGL